MEGYRHSQPALLIVIAISNLPRPMPLLVAIDDKSVNETKNLPLGAMDGERAVYREDPRCSNCSTGSKR
jgi:hypothetical protein